MPHCVSGKDDKGRGQLLRVIRATHLAAQVAEQASPDSGDATDQAPYMQCPAHPSLFPAAAVRGLAPPVPTHLRLPPLTFPPIRTLAPSPYPHGLSTLLVRVRHTTAASACVTMHANMRQTNSPVPKVKGWTAIDRPALTLPFASAVTKRIHLWLTCLRPAFQGCWPSRTAVRCAAAAPQCR